MPDPLIPDRFQVLEEIWRGDAEILVRARDKMLLREVVLKLPRPGTGFGASESKDLARSLREARTLARVHHSGVARLLDVMETGGGVMLVIEPVPGETLAERFSREGPIAPEIIRVLGIRLCEALEAVHAVGVVHRGISGENIVLRADGSPCLTGFVFAKFGHNTHSTVPGTTYLYRPAGTASGQRVVLPPLPAPEQIQGQVADARSDVFGLGWVLYECLTGQPPYPQELDCEHWPVPKEPRRVVPETSRALSDAILKCLSPSPLKRFSSAAAVRQALEGAAPQAAAPLAATRTSKRPLVLAGAGGALALVIAAGAYVASTRDSTAGVHAELSRGDGLRGQAVSGGGGPAYSTAYSASHALLIGIGAGYESSGLTPLVNAERDVDTIAERLAAMTWENWRVTALKGAQATRQGILDALSRLAESAGRDDRVFIYYAGHGEASQRAEHRGWIIPAGAKSSADDPGHASWVPFDDFFHFFEEAPAKHILVAMDCCYGGRLAQSRSAGATVFNEKFLTQKAHVVIASGRPNERVSDGVAGENSPFAQAFLKALATPDAPVLTSTGLFVEIQKVFADYPGQSPQLARPVDSPPGGEVVFFLRK